MTDEPVLRGSDDSQEDQEITELLLEDEEENSGRRRLIIIIIIILLLLLLFWPVGPERLRDARRQSRVNREQDDKQRPAGLAKYEIISAAPMTDLMAITRKGVAVGGRFYVTNIGRQAEILDYSMVSLKDQFGMDYPAVPELTEQVYKREGKSSPWGRKLASGRRIKVVAVFSAFAAPKKGYSLIGHDFEWTAEKSKEFELGTFDTLPARGYMPPDQ